MNIAEEKLLPNFDEINNEMMYQGIAFQLISAEETYKKILDGAKMGLKKRWNKEWNNFTIKNCEDVVREFSELRAHLLHIQEEKVLRMVEKVMSRQKWIVNIDNLINICQEIKKELEA